MKTNGGIKAALLLATVLTLVIPSAGAQNVASFCSNLVPAQPVLSGGSGSASVNAANSIIGVSLLIMLVMLNIAALCYLVGSSFRLDSLARFGRTEIGEVFLTILIVIIFIGSFQAVNALPSTGNYLAISPGTITTGSTGIFQTDCQNLAAASVGIINDFLPLYLSQQTITAVSSLTFGASINNYGGSASPYAGLSIPIALINNLVTTIFILIGLPLAASAIVGIFFAIGPIFLYLGIVLRTLPFSRAAGGTFLGMFLGFYILFPLLLFLFIQQVQIASLSFSSYSIGTVLNTGISSTTNYWVPSYNQLGLGLVFTFIQAVVGELFYIIVAVILSLVISFDFMEAAGDLLGAPSLSSSDTLKKLI